MNHSEAIKSNAAEGYLLGDLSDAETAAFEEHYFDCRVCAQTLRAGAAMFASGREVAKSQKGKVLPFPIRWIADRAVAASLTMVVGIQSVVIAQRWLHPVPVFEIATQGPVLRGTTRAGENEAVVRFQGDQPVQASVEISPDPPYPSYRLELRNSSGKVLEVSTATAELVRDEEGRSLPFLLRPLPAGRYVLAIEGVHEDGNRSPIISPVFVVH
jgi:hypothetical protein